MDIKRTTTAPATPTLRIRSNSAAHPEDREDEMSPGIDASGWQTPGRGMPMRRAPAPTVSGTPGLGRRTSSLPRDDGSWGDTALCERAAAEIRAAVDSIQRTRSAVKARVQEEQEEHKFEENVQFAKAATEGPGEFGSRAVGGHKPDDEKMYGQIESADYRATALSPQPSLSEIFHTLPLTALS